MQNLINFLQKISDFKIDNEVKKKAAAHYLYLLVTTNHSMYISKYLNILDNINKYFNCYTYSNKTHIPHFKLNIEVPVYNTETGTFDNFEPNVLNNKVSDIIIIPIVIYNNNKCFHTVNFYINFNHKYCIYFDPYGNTNNLLVDSSDTKNIVSYIKNELIINEIIDKKYKFIIVNESYQLNLSANKHDWFYVYSAPYIQLIFSAFVNLNVNSSYAKIVKNINTLNKYAKKNKDDFKSLIVNIDLLNPET